jgi:hypothetical protein
MIALNVKKILKSPNSCLKMSSVVNGENLPESHLQRVIAGRKRKRLTVYYGIRQLKSKFPGINRPYIPA